MNLPNLWSAPEWVWPGVSFLLLAAALLFWSYRAGVGPTWLRWVCPLLKAAGLGLLVLILVEPKRSRQVPVPGANLFVVLADKSQSLTIRDPGLGKQRDEQLLELLAAETQGESGWKQQLAEQFDLRRYAFDAALRPVNDFGNYEADGLGSGLLGALDTLSQRVAGRPCGGILLLTDGNATDGNAVAEQLARLDAAALPPVYPVMLGSQRQGRDLKITRLTIKETNFEAAPVVVTAEMTATGYAGRTVVARLIDENGKELQRKTVTDVQDGRRFAVRFEVLPVGVGVHFYQVQAGEQSELEKYGDALTSSFTSADRTERGADGASMSLAAADARWITEVGAQTAGQAPGAPVTRSPGTEDSATENSVSGADFSAAADVTWANNVRGFSVDRGRGPFRILYVGGRPNWEFKFLNRALYSDEELRLVGLLRVARREPKFSFRGHIEESTNPLFRGFGNQQDQTAEQYDEPVLIRLGARDKDELAAGFPNEAAGLFAFDAVILDDVEAEFFTQQQMSLLQEFVSLRGGTLLMLGGQESFGPGGYDRTPIGEMLPVYVDRLPDSPAAQRYRWRLTRDGQLTPWVRVRKTEAEEDERLGKMTEFRTLNRVASIKPGATVLAEVVDSRGQSLPALVTQKFGQGATGAMLVGDYWRWHMTDEGETSDLYSSWRQLARWMVADVPRRLEVSVRPAGQMPGEFEVRVSVRDDEFQPELNAQIELAVSGPNDESVAPATSSGAGESNKPLPGTRLVCRPLDDEPGVYAARYVCRDAGNHRVVARVTSDAEAESWVQNSGWVYQPSLLEFDQIAPNRELLQQIAERTGGRMVDPGELEQFAGSVPTSNSLVTQTEITPWWHQWQLLLMILACFVGEWGLRRWKGLA